MPRSRAAACSVRDGLRHGRRGTNGKTARQAACARLACRSMRCVRFGTAGWQRPAARAASTALRIVGRNARSHHGSPSASLRVRAGADGNRCTPFAAACLSGACLAHRIEQGATSHARGGRTYSAAPCRAGGPAASVLAPKRTRFSLFAHSPGRLRGARLDLLTSGSSVASGVDSSCLRDGKSPLPSLAAMTTQRRSLARAGRARRGGGERNGPFLKRAPLAIGRSGANPPTFLM